MTISMGTWTKICLPQTCMNLYHSLATLARESLTTSSASLGRYRGISFVMAAVLVGSKLLEQVKSFYQVSEDLQLSNCCVRFEF